MLEEIWGGGFIYLFGGIIAVILCLLSKTWDENGKNQKQIEFLDFKRYTQSK